MSQISKSTFRRVRSRENARDYIAQRFEKSRRGRAKDRKERAFARELMDIVGPDGEVADIAAGSGRFTDILGKAAFLISLDFDANMLAEIAERSSGPAGSRLAVGDAAALPLSDGSVDLAFCMRLLHHIADSSVRTAILSELARISRRWVAVSHYRKESWAVWRKKLRGKDVAGNPIWSSEFTAEAEKAGLRRVKTVRMPFVGTAQTLVLFEKR